MPIYEYACGKCGHEFEREQRISDDPLKTCPRCRAPRAQRLISRTSFVLKGSGWYKDLYASRKTRAAADGGTDAKEAPAAAADAKPSAEGGDSTGASKKEKKGKKGEKGKKGKSGTKAAA